MSIQIKLIGPQSAKYRNIKEVIVAYSKENSIGLSIIESNNFSDILEDNIGGIPAIKYGKTTILFDDTKDIHHGLSELFQLINSSPEHSAQNHGHDTKSCLSCSNCQCTNFTPDYMPKIMINDKLLEI